MLGRNAVGGNNPAPPDPFVFMGVSGMGVTKPYKIRWFRDTYARNPIKK
jgi:hypothetical protein